jgi:hypothetical protein
LDPNLEWALPSKVGMLSWAIPINFIYILLHRNPDKDGVLKVNLAAVNFIKTSRKSKKLSILLSFYLLTATELLIISGLQSHKPYAFLWSFTFI